MPKGKDEETANDEIKEENTKDENINDFTEIKKMLKEVYDKICQQKMKTKEEIEKIEVPKPEPPKEEKQKKTSWLSRIW